ncbi:DEAD/DEAH box helicase [bacterium]|nr:DEAD/DEAH box helicase [bacterium]
MKIQPTGPSRPAPLQRPLTAAPGPDAPSDGYGGTVKTVPSVSLSWVPLTQAPVRGLAQTGAHTALSASTGWLAKFSNLGVALRDWVTGRTSRLEQAQQVATAVLAQEQAMASLTDPQLRAKTDEFRTRLASGASLDDIQVEAFAVAREAARRATGLTANDKQLLGAAFAHQGCIVEMKTGEGKTLMEAMPAYLHALSGKGVHIITANDYLAQRDQSTMNPIFEKLGLTTSVVSRALPEDQRKAANQADIAYGTASEFGFQYLTDHLTTDPNARVSRDLSQVFALVDEADKVLLDEASTPLIISQNVAEDPKPTRVMATVVKHLKEGVDFQTDLKTRQAWLTEPGLERVEKILGVGDLYSAKNEELVAYLHTAVQARALYQNGVHYLNSNHEIVLIDEFTGRPKPGHRFSEGLHQAIEAAEGLVPGDAMLTMASITYPNCLRMYGKLAGMTGTGQSSEHEFQQVYGLNVQPVPTHRPVVRKDLDDVMFASAKGRDTALADHVAQLHQQGRPVLLGTRSIERSEDFSRLLQERGIPHQVLNAKNLEAEADIIAQAGRLGAVTVATNMAGRGTDIKLGGDPALLGGNPEAQQQCANEKARVIALGGLAVLGSERHEARRIDEQLAGRAGRQGDPGSSQFWLSQQDELFQLHVEKAALAKLEPPQLVRQAQLHADEKSLEMREFSLKYDRVVNKQRSLVYEARDAVLDGSDVQENLGDFVTRICGSFETRSSDLDQQRLVQDANYLLGDPQPRVALPAKGRSAWLKSALEKELAAQSERMGPALPGILAAVYLRSLDREWMEQISELDGLREGNAWEASQEENPVQYYEKKAHEAFNEMLDRVAARTVHGLLAARPMQPAPPPPSLSSEDRKGPDFLGSS